MFNIVQPQKSKSGGKESWQFLFQELWTWEFVEVSLMLILVGVAW